MYSMPDKFSDEIRRDLLCKLMNGVVFDWKALYLENGSMSQF